MRIVQATKLGSVHGYKILEADTPSPRENEVLIKVAVCGMGYVDALVALGGYQVKPPVPYIPGQEIAGIVQAVGEKVKVLAAGDRVMTSGYGGGLAEFMVGHEAAVTKIPDAMTFDQACGFKVNYVTVMHALLDRGEVQSGEHLVVFGAAGGVGSAAVQVGGLLGANVVAVASSKMKRDFAAGLGAAVTLDTDAEGWRDRLKAACGDKGPDVIFDPVTGPLFELAFRSLGWRGRYLVIGFTGGPIPKLPIHLALLKGASLVGVDARQFMAFEDEHVQRHVSQLLAWVAEGKLIPPVGREFAFEDFADAMRFATSGEGMAKTVIRVAAIPEALN